MSQPKISQEFKVLRGNGFFFKIIDLKILSSVGVTSHPKIPLKVIYFQGRMSVLWKKTVGQKLLSKLTPSVFVFPREDHQIGPDVYGLPGPGLFWHIPKLNTFVICWNNVKKP